MHVRMFNPSSIAHATNLAKLHEAAQPSPQRTTSRFSPFSKSPGLLTKPTVSPSSSTPVVSSNHKPNSTHPIRSYSANEIAERRAKGLCMFCDEQFTPGHQFKHKKSQLMVLEMDDDDEAPIEEPTIELVGDESETLQAFENPQLSLQALTGVANYHTMRVTGLHDKKLLHILLDSGSTHNFLDLEMAKKLGCKLEAISPLSVTGGGGHQLKAAFIWIQWLKSLGPIIWDFDKLQMEFTTDNRKFVLRGAKTQNLKLINNKSFAQAVQKGAELSFLSVTNRDDPFIIPTCHALQASDSSVALPKAFEQLLVQYGDIFEEPTALPPSRPGFDHKIPLKEGVQPFNLRPYRFSLVQKDVIDKLVQDMLD
ncbi:gypsy/Ty-3 retroelement polyprotein, partial [Trifolium medium]|nr:gypsy/Ty-3 retroelement polyprotein [Trifolium medium]